MRAFRTLMPLAVLGALLVLPSMAEAEDTYNLAVNTARVWLTQMEEVAAEAQDAAATAGLPPVDLNFTITRDHRWLTCCLAGTA